MKSQDKKAASNLPKKKGKADDYIRSIGHSMFMVNLLKGIVVIMALVLIAESFLIVSLLGKVSEVKPLPIFVDREAGTARPVDFEVIDATGAKRDDAEIHDFVRDYVGNIYTFTNHTVETNLRRVLDQSSDEARNAIKNVIYQARRNENLVSGYQGTCKFRSISIIEASSSLIRAQAIFDENIFGVGQDSLRSRRKIATLAMKTIIRQRENAHGLYVVEYRESDIKE